MSWPAMTMVTSKMRTAMETGALLTPRTQLQALPEDESIISPASPGPWHLDACMAHLSRRNVG